MAIRNVVKIDEELCNGCGECILNYVVGALQIVTVRLGLLKA